MTSANSPTAVAKTLAAALVLSVLGVLIMGPRVPRSNAALQERTLETKYIREHVPIRVKIKKERNSRSRT